MSFDAHEAFSFDSFSQQLLFWDDFEGDSLKDLWRSTGDAGGSAVVVDAQTGGIVRITTDGDDGDQWQLDWGNIRSLHVDQNACIEMRIKFNQVTNVIHEFGLNKDSDERVLFFFNPAVGVNWQAFTRNGGASTTTDTGILADTDYHIFRVETTTTSITYYIDDVLVATITTNIPSDVGDEMQPFVNAIADENVAKTVDVDYIYVRQER